MQLFFALSTLFFATLTSTCFGKPLEKRQTPSEIDRRKILHAHNKYRAHHDAQPLSWDKGLAESASHWSEQCLSAYSGTDYGENMAFGRGNDWEAIVNLWYNEVANYDFTKPGSSLHTGHFTQLVWKDTFSIGCGATVCSNLGYTVYVCRYEPSGNILAWGDDEGIFFRGNVSEKVTY